MNHNKLDRLEHQIAALVDGQGTLVSVTFANGQTRRMRLPDVIPLLRDGAGQKVVDVSGEARPEDGQLLDLIRGIVEELPE